MVFRSLLELESSGATDGVNVDQMVDKVFRQLGKGAADDLTLEDFKKIMFDETDDIWKTAVLDLNGRADSVIFFHHCRP